MQAIVGRLEELFERLGRVNYERLFVVSVVVATLTGSLYVYLVDFYFARSADQAIAADPLVSDRIAPIGRVTLAEPVVAVPAAETALATTDATTDAPAGESAPIESSAEGDVAEASAFDAGSTDVAAASTELPPELATNQTEDRAAVPADPIETLPGSAEAGGAVAAPSESSIPSEKPRTTGPAVTAETPPPVPTYPPLPPGYMPMPAQGYAPVYPHYQAPPTVSRQVPGAPSWYAPRPYQAYPAPRYDRPAAPANGYPPPQGWVR